ncbi:unnamed protein product [Dovyalis caffra]|uniref:Uncharacterized protein n=1 Tax=Dovyalis caffra TaxID=77055 RepID=A0AAV1SAI2_9ROSI|nr:unnamed protein product [Dovyalis caffra]
MLLQVSLESTLDEVLANFDGELGVPYSSLLDDVVMVSYGIHLMFVFPIVFFSVCLNLDGLLYPYAISIAHDNRRFLLVTLALMGFIFVGANFVPTIWDAFQFTGAVAAIAVGFIFPAAVALTDPNGIATKNDRLKTINQDHEDDILASACSLKKIKQDHEAGLQFLCLIAGPTKVTEN